jgi:16S rRNA G966 N2-methylase RsmD
VKVIRENLRRTKTQHAGRVRRQDVVRALRSRPGQFDLVVVDAPYKLPESDLDAVLGEIAGHGSAAAEALVVLSRPPKGYMPVIPIHWHLERQLSYGDVVLFLYRTP